MNRIFFNLFQVLLILLLIFIMILILIRISIIHYARNKTYVIQNLPYTDTAIIFGAGLRKDGTPTSVLMDRVKTGVDLFQAGKVKNLLMSGDNRYEDYNEPASMAIYAQELGVPPANILIDNEGKSTYQSCIRAKNIFKLDKAILITQSFHLPRALYICNKIGIKATGISADLRQYWFSSSIIWNLREFPASFVAVVDVFLSQLNNFNK